MTTLDDRIMDVIEAAEAVADWYATLARHGAMMPSAGKRLTAAVAAYHVARDAQAVTDADARARLDRDGLYASDGMVWDGSTGGGP